MAAIDSSRPHFSVGGWLSLPDECWITILTYLELDSLESVAQVAKSINFIVGSRDFWKAYTRLHTPDFFSLKTYKKDKNSLPFLYWTESKIIQATSKKTIEIYDVEQGKLAKVIYKCTTCLSALLLVDDQLIAGDRSDQIHFINLTTSAITSTSTDENIHAFAAAHGTLYCAAGNTGEIKAWDLNTKLPKPSLKGHSARVCALIYAHEKLYSGSDDHTIKEWDLEKNVCERTFTGHTYLVSALAYDRGTLISGSWDLSIRFWDLEKGACKKVIEESHSDSVRRLAMAKNRLFSAADDGSIKVWDHQGKCLATFKEHSDKVCTLFFSHKRIFSGSKDGTIKEWGTKYRHWIERSGIPSKPKDVKSRTPIPTKKSSQYERYVLTNTLKNIRAAYDETLVLLDTCMMHGVWESHAIKIIDTDTGAQKGLLEGHKDCITVAYYVECQQQLFSGSFDKKIKGWDLERLKCTTTFDDQRKIRSLTFDATLVISSSWDDNEIKLWDVRSGKNTRVLRGHTGFLSSIDADEGKIYSDASETCIWDIGSGKCEKVIKALKTSRQDPLRYREGKLFKCSFSSQSIEVYDLERDSIGAQFKYHPKISEIHFTQQDLITGSEEGLIKVWDYEKGQCEQIMFHHDVISAFASHDNRLVTYSLDRELKLWTKGKNLV